MWRKVAETNFLKKISIICVLTFLFTLPFVQPIFASSNPSVQYRTHLQNFGWTGESSNGDVSGTTGQARRMEAIAIDASVPIQYQAHVQNKGWLPWVQNGEEAGTTGQALRMEAIRIQVKDSSADIEYRVHVQNRGWLPWVRNGEIAGTTGQSLRAEAIQIRFVSKQTGFAGIVANSQTAQKTNQIITTVASGSSAQVTFWERGNDGLWNAVFSTNGYVGSRGVGPVHESSLRTPEGSYSLGLAFGTGGNPGTALPYRQITRHSWWVSDVNSNVYNTWQESSAGFTHSEHLADYPVQYQYAVVINYNMINPVKGAGSGFFLHVTNGRPTAGCVAIPRDYMLQTLQRLQPGAYIINVTSEQEVANY